MISRVFLALVLLVSGLAAAQQRPVELTAPATVPFHFIAYGDTRFTDPKDTEASNPDVRRTLVKAIADSQPAFVSIGGDISYVGARAADWEVWDKETAIWRERKLPVYPALGNHDLNGDQNTALANYFERFPELRSSRYYSVRAANCLLLMLDSSLDELSGPQGDWLKSKFANLPTNVDFVFLVLHHPPYTSSSDEKKYGGGHSARHSEMALGSFLETEQKQIRQRIVVIAGHVHNYERHEHGGVTYFVTGGGGAHAYPIERAPGDPFQSNEINYHYLDLAVDRGKLTVTMHRLQLAATGASWTTPDSVTIKAEDSATTAAAAQQDSR